MVWYKSRRTNTSSEVSYNGWVPITSLHPNSSTRTSAKVRYDRNPSVPEIRS